MVFLADIFRIDSQNYIRQNKFVQHKMIETGISIYNQLSLLPGKKLIICYNQGEQSFDSEYLLLRKSSCLDIKTQCSLEFPFERTSWIR